MFSYNLCVLSNDNQKIQSGIVETENPISAGDKLVLTLSKESIDKLKEKNESGELSKVKKLVVTQITHYPKTSQNKAFSEAYVISKETFDI